MRTAPIAPVPFTAIRLGPGFWHARLETNRRVSIPHAFERCEHEGRVANFERAAQALRGQPVEDRRPPGFPFDDTDVYKVLEAAAYTLAIEPDATLDQRLDELIAAIAAAQEPDGYLYTTRTLAPEAPHAWAGRERWELETALSHELYNLGHLFEAAVAHFRATGKASLLDVALRAADLLCRTFGPGKATIWPGHQITEMGLVGLYRLTGETRYLDLARFLLDARGPDGSPSSGEKDNQSHTRVVEQETAVGHAVRAVYMYSGMADVAAAGGASDYLDPLSRIWADIVAHKLYITGGIGSKAIGEAFGDPDALPNLTAYNETCASIGLVYFSHRMFLLHGGVEYIDVLERVLYNGLVSGVSLDGTHFFYPNPLESFGEYQRSAWFGCACCPGNVTRFIASVAGYQYARQGSTLYVNLYMAGVAQIELEAGVQVSLSMHTRYPWDGAVRINVDSSIGTEWTLKLRIPGWARGDVVPSDLYHFLGSDDSAPTLMINGDAQPLTCEQGYAVVRRRWHPGDAVDLHLPMPVRRVAAHNRVAADRGRVALQRGPIVYALEGPDHDAHRVLDVFLPDEAPLQAAFQPELLGGCVVIHSAAQRLFYEAPGRVVSEPVAMTAIPYFAWAHRGPSEMTVWIPNVAESAWLRPLPSIASASYVTLSAGECAKAANDQAEAASSHDESHKRTRLVPAVNGSTWVQYDFDAPTRISSVSVYWFETQDWRHETAPECWRLVVYDGRGWQPVEAHDAHTTELHRFNRVTFSPVIAAAVRLDCKPRLNFAVGLLEWQVE